MTTKYTRNDLARIAQSLRDIKTVGSEAGYMHDPRGMIKRTWREDLDLAAGFLEDTVAVLDRQKKIRRDRIATDMIETRRRQRRDRR